MLRGGAGVVGPRALAGEGREGTRGDGGIGELLRRIEQRDQRVETLGGQPGEIDGGGTGEDEAARMGGDGEPGGAGGGGKVHEGGRGGGRGRQAEGMDPAVGERSEVGGDGVGLRGGIDEDAEKAGGHEHGGVTEFRLAVAQVAFVEPDFGAANVGVAAAGEHGDVVANQGKRGGAGLGGVGAGRRQLRRCRGYRSGGRAARNGEPGEDKETEAGQLHRRGANQRG